MLVSEGPQQGGQGWGSECPLLDTRAPCPDRHGQAVSGERAQGWSGQSSFLCLCLPLAPLQRCSLSSLVR